MSSATPKAIGIKKPSMKLHHHLKKKNGTNTREFTLHARSSNNSTKQHYQNIAPRVLEEVFKFANQSMGCNQVKIQSALFQHIWLTGIDGPPIRVRFSRKLVRDDNDAKTYKTCAFVTMVEVNKRI